MQMRPQIQIASVLKALTDVVLPALDPHNKLALEQLQLSIGMLRLMAQQLPLQYRFDIDELSRLLNLARDLKTQALGGSDTRAAADALHELTTAAQESLDASRAGPEEVVRWVRALRSAAGAVVTQVYVDGDPGCRDQIRDTVLAMSKDQLLRDRAMLAAQGWEPDPAAVPPIASLLEDISAPRLRA